MLGLNAFFDKLNIKSVKSCFPCVCFKKSRSRDFNFSTVCFTKLTLIRHNLTKRAYLCERQFNFSPLFGGFPRPPFLPNGFTKSLQQSLQLKVTAIRIVRQYFDIESLRKVASQHLSWVSNKSEMALPKIFVYRVLFFQQIIQIRITQSISNENKSTGSQ